MEKEFKVKTNEEVIKKMYQQKEFNLSEKITALGWIHEKNIKEFIKRLKSRMYELYGDGEFIPIINHVIDRLAGPKLS